MIRKLSIEYYTIKVFYIFQKLSEKNLLAPTKITYL